MWATALFYSLLGVSDGAAKLFSASTGFFTVVALYFTARRMAGHRFAMVAGTIMVTSLYFVDYARKARLEVPLTFFLFLSFAAIVQSVERRNRRWAIASGAAMALAFLVKGVPALAAAVIVGAAILLGEEGWKRRAITAGAFLVGAAALLLPWIVGQFVVDEGRFFDWYSQRQVAWSVEGRPDRSGSSVHAMSLWFYTRKLFTEVMVPGAALGLLGAVSLLRRRRWRDDRFLLIALLAALTIVGAFAMIPFHKARYLLPALPFLALLGAGFFHHVRWEDRAAKVATGLVVGATAVLLLLSVASPIHFYTKKDGGFLPLAPWISTAVAPTDSLLVGGMREYTAQQVFTWYFDRPLMIVSDSAAFAARWRTGRYAAGVLSNADADSPPAMRAFATSGRYRLFLRDAQGPVPVDLTNSGATR
jgi:4-amino-4-deoxy-L-arabinose transferase-like glycosyltransferase